MPAHVGPHKPIAFARGHALIFKAEARSRDPEGKATLRGRTGAFIKKQVGGSKLTSGERRRHQRLEESGLVESPVDSQDGNLRRRTAGDG